ncbi:MAG: polyphenol oxidase, partial [Candidatus Marinimicrobia bacterium]|nr:polyphenol oxidase [Candidatus Neomarinimicrobiota bacterium]
MVKKQLFDIGFIEENIILDNQCTSCNDKKFYSYRRDNKN